MNPLLPLFESDDVLTLARMPVSQMEVDQNGRTPLHQAVAAGATDCALWLLDQSPLALDVADNHGETPLMRAAWMGHDVLAQALVDRGANLQARSLVGGAALHHAHASTNPSEKTVSILVKAGADPAAQDESGKTPEQWGAYGHAIQAGADLAAPPRAPRVLRLKKG